MVAATLAAAQLCSSATSLQPAVASLRMQPATSLSAQVLCRVVVEPDAAMMLDMAFEDSGTVAEVALWE